MPARDLLQSLKRKRPRQWWPSSPLPRHRVRCDVASDVKSITSRQDGISKHPGPTQRIHDSGEKKEAARVDHEEVRAGMLGHVGGHMCFGK